MLLRRNERYTNLVLLQAHPKNLAALRPYSLRAHRNGRTCHRSPVLDCVDSPVRRMRSTPSLRWITRPPSSCLDNTMLATACGEGGKGGWPHKG